MSPLPVPTRMGNLIINPGGTTPGELETAMRNPAWCVQDMGAFWEFPGFRGDNLTVPGGPGTRALAKPLNEGVYVSEFHIVGDITVSGAVTATPADVFEGLRANCDYLWENVHTLPTGSAVRQARLVLPGGSYVDAEVQCRIHLGQQKIADRFGGFEITVPAGRLG